ncbi:MAG: 16S rRNA (cytosine(967)-C(5))-methyltransferase RsmB, partial [Bacilli bacterium]
NVLLLMSIYQIVFMDVSDYASVNESVNIANLLDKKVAGFVNAVLRNFLRNPLREIPEDDELLYLSIKYSYPTWLIAYLLKDYNHDTVEKILKQNDESRKTSIRVNTLKSTMEKVIDVLEKEKIEYESTDLVKNGLIIKKTIVDNALQENGEIIIQDLSSQRVAEVCDPVPGSIVIDLCAAPGGKTAHMAALMNNTGTIYACDIYPKKIKKMKQNFKKWGIQNVKCEIIDARRVTELVKNESFDYVLADLPCSGLGVMGHKSDLKYNITLDNIKEIIKLQREILESSYKLIKLNKYLIFSTCTINKAENEENVRWLLKEHPDLKIEYEQTILPFEYDSDGFYVCKIRKCE